MSIRPCLVAEKISNYAPENWNINAMSSAIYLGEGEGEGEELGSGKKGPLSVNKNNRNRI